MAEDVRIHHLRSDHGDDDLVAADDAAPGGFGEGELVRDGPQTSGASIEKTSRASPSRSRWRTS